MVTSKGAQEELRESERRFRQLFENSGDAIFVHNREGGIVDVNRRACESLGYTKEELLSLSVADIEHHVGSGDLARMWERVVSGEHLTIEGVHRRKDGATFPVEVQVGLFETGRRWLVLAVARDVTKRKRTEKTLKEREIRYRQLFEQSSDALFVHDEMGTIVDCNIEACRSLGYSREELLALSVEDFGLKLISNEEGLDKDGMLWQRVMAAELGTVASVVFGQHRRKDGATFPVEVSVSGIDYGDRRLILASCRDLTEREKLEERLAHQAFHDSLTGLPNRALLLDRLEQALTRTERGGGLVAILFIDLDNFKHVNDSLGHETGDRLLVAVAERLRACLRPGDTAARLGGDEFTVLLEGVADVSAATHVAERIIETLQRPFEIEGRQLFTGTSIGVVLGAAARIRPGDLLRKADLALYQAKGAGKARYAVYDPSMSIRAFEQMRLGNDLRRALKRGEFAVRYQPKVDLATGKIVGMEALTRWKHPKRGPIPPSKFIPLAEETNLIVPLGRWVLEETCRQVREWQALYPKETPLAVIVNLSARQFEHEDLAQDVAQTLEESGLEAKHLVLEITENTVMKDAPLTAKIMRDLKDLGTKLSIDDFGTGYSSLSYLKRFTVDYLKVDRSFVEGLGEDPNDTVVVSGIVSLAHAMGLKVVAEGVETEEQFQRLSEMGCDMAQGYHFAEPLSSAEAAELLASDPRWP